MRRSFITLASVTMLTMAAVMPVAAAQPVHTRPAPSEPFVFAAGEMCDFALSSAASVSRDTTSEWETADGTFRSLSRGYAAGVTTNTDDDISFSDPGGYKIDIVFHPDGSIDVKGSGVLTAFYFPGDPVEGLTAGAFAVHGYLTEHYAADGSLTSATFHGRIVADLCEVLAPPA